MTRTHDESLPPVKSGDFPILPDEGASPLHFQRLAHATLNYLGAVGVDVTAEVLEDGRLALTLPLQWGYLLLSNLAAQAEAFKEKLRKAAWEAQARQAPLEAVLEASRQWWEKEQESLFKEYRKLVAEGHSEKEALAKLRAKSETYDLTLFKEVLRQQAAKERGATILALVNQGMEKPAIAERLSLSLHQVSTILGKWRRKQTGEAWEQQVRAKAEAARETILTLSRQGQKPKQIAQTLSFPRWAVRGVLEAARKRGDLPPGPRRRLADAKRTQILTLAAQGLRPKAIAEAVGVNPYCVYQVMYRAGLRGRKGGDDGQAHHPETGSQSLHRGAEAPGPGHVPGRAGGVHGA